MLLLLISKNMETSKTAKNDDKCLLYHFGNAAVTDFSGE